MVSPSKNPMQAIWDSIAQPDPDGNKYIHWRDRRDIEYLYDTGFVDTDKFSLKEWVEAFRDSLLPNESYRVTLDQWLAKTPFRYNGPTGQPFNPLTIREGEWSPEELWDLIEKQFLPATTLKRDHYEKMLQKGKEAGRFIDGKYIINKPFKFGLKQLVDTYASPKRRRELAVAEAREDLKREKPVLKPAQKPAASGPSQKTSFTTGQSQEQKTADQLSKLLWKGQK